MSRALFVLLLVGPAWAYTAATSSEGQPLHWAEPVVRVAIEMPSNLEGAPAALAAACQSWSALPESRLLIEMGEGAVQVRFRRQDWPYAPDMLALTTVQTHPDTGVIAGALVEVNQVHHEFTIGGARAGLDAYDLQAVLTHELGHVLGLGHSADTTATMYASTAPWDTHQQTPTADDRAGISFLYDRAAPAPAAGGCAMGGAGGSGNSLIVVVLALWIWRRRQANPRSSVMAMTNGERQNLEVRVGRAVR